MSVPVHFDNNREYYNESTTQRLMVPTADTRELMAVAQRLLKRIYLAGHSYQRGGVLLMDLVSHRFQQLLATENLSLLHRTFTAEG